MPQITPYRRQFSIPSEAPNVPANLGTAGIVGEAIAGFGRTGMAVTNEIVNLVKSQNEDIRRRNVASATADLTNKAKTFLRESTIAYDLGAKKLDAPPIDSAKYNQEKTSEFKNSLRSYLNISNITDPDMLANAEQIIGNGEALFADHVALSQVKANKEFADKVGIEALQIGINNVRDGKSLEEQINYFTNIIKSQHEAGTYDIKEATNIIVNGQQQLARSYFDSLTVNYPKRAVEELKSNKYNQYLTEEAYRHFNEKALILGKAEEKIQNENTAYQAIIEANTDPITGRIDTAKALVQSQTADKVGNVDLSKLDLNTRQNIAGSIRAIDAAQKEARKGEINLKLAPIEASMINYDPVKNPKSLTTARNGILKLMADPDNMEFMSELQQVSRAVNGMIRNIESEARVISRENRYEARIVKQEADDNANANMLIRVSNGEFANIYDPEQGKRDLISVATELNVPRKSLVGYINMNKEVMKNAGQMNYFTQVVSTLKKASTEGSSTYIEDLAKNQDRIINSIQYYMANPGELDKSLGDKPITVYNPKVIDIYNKFVEKSDKESFFGYDFTPFLRALPSPGKSFVAPQKETPEGGGKPPLTQKRKLIGTKGGKNVYELPNGKWQVGD